VRYALERPLCDFPHPHSSLPAMLRIALLGRLERRQS